MSSEGSSPTVLNVNDRETARYYISIVLKRGGFRVVEACTGEEALQAAQAMPDVIVLDVKLPDMSGHEVCRRLRADPKTASLCIIQTSASYVGLDAKLEGLSSGADAYLAQPFEPEELIATVRALLRARTAERAANEARREAEEARKKAEAALRARDEFLGMASHELRNPASAVHLQLESLLRMARHGPIEPDVLTNKLSLASQSAHHLVSLLHNLLDASGIREGKMQLRPEEAELGSIVADVATRMSDEAQRADCIIDVHAPAPLSGMWDRTRLNQIATNLLSNAIKYASGGPITVSVLPWSNGSAMLSVRDHGPGVPPDAQTRIFDRFERANSDIKSSGFGLGLWIVKSIVDAMGGQISVENEATGGATFKVILPRHSVGEGKVAKAG